MECTYLTLKSYAKLNLCLRVYPPLPSNQSFHPICGIFQTLSLHDTLTIRLLSEKRCQILCDSPEVPLDETNDIVKAYSALKDRLGFGIEVNVTKRIPVGAGLAGGSSNAATVLQFLNPLCEPEYSLSELQNLASLIGCDVSYFLHGGTCCVTTGHGVSVEPLKEMAMKWFLLIYPNVKASTASVFKAFDRHSDRKSPSLGGNLPDLENNLGENDLTQATFHLYPVVRELHRKLSEMDLGDIYMTGSGSTLYIPVAGEKDGESLKNIVCKEMKDVWACVTHTQPFSYQLENQTACLSDGKVKVSNVLPKGCGFEPL